MLPAPPLLRAAGARLLPGMSGRHNGVRGREGRGLSARPGRLTPAGREKPRGVSLGPTIIVVFFYIFTR